MNGQESLHILAGWLVDGSGGPIQRGVLLTIQNGMVRSLAPQVDSDLPTAGWFHLPQCTIIPALVDGHVHLCMSGSSDPSVRQAQMMMSFEQAQIAIAAHLADNVAHGIMAVRDGGDYAAHALRFKQNLLPDARGSVVLRCAGRGWHAQGRYGRFIGCSPAPGERLPDAVRRCDGAMDHLKVIHSGVNSLAEFGRPTAPQFPLAELRDAVTMAASRGLKTMVHANGVAPVQEALEAGCHSIEHGYFMGRENLERLAQRQICWTPTVFPMAAYARASVLLPQETDVARRTVAHQLEQLRMARELGVTVVLGTDSGSFGVEHGKAVAQELRLFVEAGYPLAAALQCATAHGARLLGLENELGRVAPGMPASFVIIEGPPAGLLDRMMTPHSVWVRGRMLMCGKQERQ